MRPALRKAIEYALCVAAVVIVPLAVLYPTVILGRLPFDTDSVLFMSPWEEARPAGLEPPNATETDLVSQRYYPWYAFLSDAAQRGDSVLWSPYEGFGKPFLALWRSRCFSPFSVPFYLWPLDQALRLSVLLKFLMAGLAAFYMARRLGFALPLSTFVAVTFQLSAQMIIYRVEPLGDVLPWLPFLVVFGERLALGQLRMWPLGAITLSLMLAGGEPAAVLSIVAVVALYLALRIIVGRRSIGELPRAMALFLVAAVVALGLAAVQLVPHLEFLREAAPANASSANWPTAKALVACFFPDFWGRDLSATAQGIDASQMLAARLLHFGLFPVLLLPLWFAVRKHTTAAQRQRIEPMLITCAVMMTLTIALGYAATRWAIPAYVRPEYLLAGNALLLAMAAAAAAEEWVLLNAEECTSALKRLLVFVLALAVIVVALAIITRKEPRPHAPDFWVQAIVFGVFAAVLAALLMTTLLRPSPRIIGYGLWALSCIQLTLAFYPSLSFADPERVFPETSFIRALKSSGERVAGTQALSVWPLSGNLVAQIGTPGMQTPGPTSLKREVAFLSRIEDDPYLLRRTGASNLLLTREDIQTRFAPIRPVLKVKEVFSCGAALFEDAESKPRAWMAYSARSIGEFDSSLLASERPPLVEHADPPNAEPEPEAKVVITRPVTNARLRLRVEQTRPGILVLTDAWYPGWMATVDGTPAEVFPVDGIFRGVMLGEGNHDVVFEYTPSSFVLGLRITMGAAALVFLGMIPIVVHHLRKRDQWR